jgi:hypothetical protein
MSSCLKIFNLIKFNIIIIRYGTSNNYYTEQDAFLLVMLCPVGKAGRARHHYSSYYYENVTWFHSIKTW